MTYTSPSFSMHSFPKGGTFEVFEVTPESSPLDELYGIGWFWWPCSPSCLPDADPIGPFETRQAAIDDATNACE
jgi:hypothetical protein